MFLHIFLPQVSPGFDTFRIKASTHQSTKMIRKEGPFTTLAAQKSTSKMLEMYGGTMKNFIMIGYYQHGQKANLVNELLEKEEILAERREAVIDDALLLCHTGHG